MNKMVTKLEPGVEVSTDALALLRRPFEAHHISKLPKPTKKQTEEVRADYKKGIRCKDCGQWHHPDVVHLDYVGHAALTDRLLDADPHWTWEPCAFGQDGLPAFDKTGGLWIRLTVGGVTRLGYGHADPKPNQDAGAREKEVIGDALRNAAMRFGAALDLWHKGDLHADEDAGEPKAAPAKVQQASSLTERAHNAVRKIGAQTTEADVRKAYALASNLCAELSTEAPELLAQVEKAYADALAMFAKPTADSFGIGDDEIPF